MAVVFIVQGTVFQDGGLTVLGANIVNMGLVGTFGGYYVYKLIRIAIGRQKISGMIAGVAVAAWLSVVLGSLACAVQLALSDTVPLAVALTAMLSWHSLIGIGEALISVAVGTFIWKTRPDLFYDPPLRRRLVT